MVVVDQWCCGGKGWGDGVLGEGEGGRKGVREKQPSLSYVHVVCFEIGSLPRCWFVVCFVGYVEWVALLILLIEKERVWVPVAVILAGGCGCGV